MRERKTVVALDLGGTHVSAGRVDVDSSALEEFCRIALPADAGRSEIVGRIAGAAVAVADGRATDVGVAVPGPFDYDRGICLLTHKLEQLYGVDLRHELTAALPTKTRSVAFLNDADAFLLGEWWAGAAVGHRRAVAVTLGTGLGSAFLEDGHIVDAGPQVPPEGSLHLVSFRGLPAEETISRAAVVARYGDPCLDVSDLASLARNGDVRAQLVFAELGTALGELLAPWLAAFEATCVVVGGSISRAWDLIGPPVRATLAPIPSLERIVPGARIEEAALLGAARHAAASPGLRGSAPGR